MAASNAGSSMHIRSPAHLGQPGPAQPSLRHHANDNSTHKALAPAGRRKRPASRRSAYIAAHAGSGFPSLCRRTQQHATASTACLLSFLALDSVLAARQAEPPEWPRGGTLTLFLTNVHSNGHTYGHTMVIQWSYICLNKHIRTSLYTKHTVRLSLISTLDSRLSTFDSRPSSRPRLEHASRYSWGCSVRLEQRPHASARPFPEGLGSPGH